MSSGSFLCFQVTQSCGFLATPWISNCALLTQIGEVVEKLTILQAELTESQDAQKELQQKALQLKDRLRQETEANLELQQQLGALNRENEQVHSMCLTGDSLQRMFTSFLWLHCDAMRSPVIARQILWQRQINLMHSRVHCATRWNMEYKSCHICGSTVSDDLGQLSCSSHHPDTVSLTWLCTCSSPARLNCSRMS